MDNQFFKHKRNPGNRIAVGIFIIAAGIVLLLNNLHLLPFQLPDYVFTWQMVLILLGVINLIRFHFFAGLLLMGLGAYFIAPLVTGIPEAEIRQLWPALVILVGLGILFKRSIRFKKNKFMHQQGNETVKDYLYSTAIFGGIDKKINMEEFKGGEIKAIFGGVDLDLTHVKLSPNKEDNVLDITAVFGGVSLKVPKEWNIKNHITPVMGGVDDNLKDIGVSYINPDLVLTITGSAVFGGVEIKRKG